MLDYLVGGLIGANITIVVLYAVGWWPTRSGLADITAHLAGPAEIQVTIARQLSRYDSRLIVLDNYANYHTIALDALGKRGKR